MDASSGSPVRSPLVTIMLWGTVIVLVIAGLFLPPVSLGKRLFKSDMTPLSAESPQVTHPDGLSLRVDPALLTDEVGIKLDSVPREVVVGGSVPEAWQAAASALPAYLALKSPLYVIAFDDEVSLPVSLEILIPNDAEPYRLMDLVAWDGEQWQWIPSRIDLSTDRITTDLGHAPQAVAVVQAGPQSLVVGMTAEQGDALPPETSGVVAELYPVGPSLGPGGALLGQVAGFGSAGARYRQIPTIRATEPVLVETLLADPVAQQTHLEVLADWAANGGYDGLMLEYDGVTAAQRDAFTSFVTALATRLHSSGIELMVTVPAPQSVPAVTDGWDAAGYNWPALAAVVDRLVVRLPLDPTAYTSGGPVDQLLTWAVTQVDRYRLLVAVNAAGVQQAEAAFAPISLSEALAPLDTLLTRVDPGEAELQPGNEVIVGLPAGMLAEDPAAGAYRTTYSLDGKAVTVWLPSAAALDRKLRVVTDYHLGGVVLNGLAGSEVAAELTAALSGFLAAASAPLAQVASLTWTVQDLAGGTLIQVPGDLNDPQFAWQAVATPGAYAIHGQLGIGSYQSDLGGVEVAVALAATATPTPEPSPTEAATATPTATSTPAAVAAGGTPVPTRALPTGDADAYISGALVNVREGPSTGFRQIAQLPSGTALQVLAVNPEQTWIRAQAADGTQGWIYAQLCVINVRLADVPVEVVPTPTPPPTPEGGVVQPPPAPRPSPGGTFELGGHIRSWGYLAQMAGAGMNWVKVQVHYGEDASGLIGSAHGSGFKIQLSALGNREMVNQPNFHTDYSNWVRNMAAAGADAIEVWNEPNIDAEWPLGQISPVAYTQLLCAAYGAIKNANAGTAVISAAPAPTGYFGGCSGNGCDDLPWLQGMYNAGAANCMDYLGAHHNAGATSPSATSGHPADGGGHHHSWYFLPQTQLYYGTFGGARKLFYTEMGYASQEGVPPFSDWFAWARGITNAQQAAWLAEAVTLSRSTGMVRCIIVWNIDFARYGQDPQDGYAIFRPDGSCPACSALAGAMGY